MIVDLRFTAALDKKNAIAEIADLHGFPMILISDDLILEWRLHANVSMVDLANFANDLGCAGIDAVCSEWNS